MSTTTVKSFAKQFINATVLVEQVFKDAETSLKIHIAVLEGRLQQADGNIEKCKQAASNALINDGMIILKDDVENDSAVYIQKLLDKEKAIKEATLNYEKISESLVVLKSKLKEIYKTETEKV